MYKKQLIVQKIICFAALAVSALVFLYSLGLMTDLYDSMYMSAMDPDEKVPGTEICLNMQPFNKALLAYSIVMVLLSCLLFLTSTHSRRRYYVGNVVATVGFVVPSAALSLWSHLKLEAFKAEFLKVDFELLKEYSEMWDTLYISSDNTFWFDAHYVVFGLVLLVCLLLLVNYGWKLSLMRAEKRLIEEGKKVSA